MKTAIAIYTNQAYVKSFRYKQEYIKVIPVYFKKDILLLERFLAAQKRCNLHRKFGSETKQEERNRLARRKRALKNLYKLRAQCHRRKLFSDVQGGFGEFKITKQSMLF